MVRNSIDVTESEINILKREIAYLDRLLDELAQGSCRYGGWQGSEERIGLSCMVVVRCAPDVVSFQFFGMEREARGR